VPKWGQGELYKGPLSKKVEERERGEATLKTVNTRHVTPFGEARERVYKEKKRRD